MKNTHKLVAIWLFMIGLSGSITATGAGETIQITSDPMLKRSCDQQYPNLNKALDALLARRVRLFRYYGTTQELETLERQFLHCCQEMIEGGADVNYADLTTGRTPAMIAAYFRLWSFLELLKENGAQMELKQQDGHSATDFEKISHRNFDS